MISGAVGDQILPSLKYVIIKRWLNVSVEESKIELADKIFFLFCVLKFIFIP